MSAASTEPRLALHPIGPGEWAASRPCCLCGQPTVANPYLCPAHVADSARRERATLADIDQTRAARRAGEGLA